MIGKTKSSSSSSRLQRIADFRRAKMQKQQKHRKKERRRKRERRRRRNGDASSRFDSIPPWSRSFNNGCNYPKY